MNLLLRVSITVTFYALLFFLFTACSKKLSDHSNSHQSDSSDKPSTQTYDIIEWTDLLPDEDLHALENPPEQLSEIEDGSEGDELASQLKVKVSSNDMPKDPYERALVSKNIRPEFDGRNVRIPGFIVPVDFDDQQTITTFFLVPFFGACIHLPPPPPNQIIYAEYEPGIKLETLYDPFWIDGTLATNIIENELATSAYSISVTAIEPYMEELPEDWDDAEDWDGIEDFDASDILSDPIFQDFEQSPE